MMAQRAADHHPPGDLVSRRAAFDGAKRDYGGVDRIDIARDDRLQRAPVVAISAISFPVCKFLIANRRAMRELNYG